MAIGEPVRVAASFAVGVGEAFLVVSRVVFPARLDAYSIHDGRQYLIGTGSNSRGRGNEVFDVYLR